MSPSEVKWGEAKGGMEGRAYPDIQKPGSTSMRSPVLQTVPGCGHSRQLLLLTCEVRLCHVLSAHLSGTPPMQKWPLRQAVEVSLDRQPVGESRQQTRRTQEESRQQTRRTQGEEEARCERR